jgi:epoxide hydrolase-like predicted phosphatase
VTPGVPSGVILDFGGVLWNMRWDVCRELEAEHELPPGVVFSTLYRSPAWGEIERGRGSVAAWREEAHRALEARVGRRLPLLHDLWQCRQGLIAENIALVRALRPAYRLAILSNADRTLRSRLRDGIGIHDDFDEVVCSAEVGLAKPQPEIYALTCERLGLRPAACVFVDDHEPNVAAARAVGLSAILYRVDRGDDLRAQLAALGVTPPA